MKHRILSLLLALTLLLSVTTPVTGAGHGITDIVGHWAEGDILWTMEQGLFTGTSKTTFDPDGSMTRGMFVTVLGRFAGEDPADYQDWYLPGLYRDLNSSFYYAPYVNWATRYGITTGDGSGTFSPEQPINREQMAVFMVRFAKTYGYEFQPIRSNTVPAFADRNKISDFAREAVEIMRQCGVLTGRRNADGTYDFDPHALAARSECAAVFRRLMDSLVENPEAPQVLPQQITLSQQEASCCPEEQLQLSYVLEPTASTVGTVLWFSSNPEVATVNSKGLVTCKADGFAEIYAYTANGLYDICAVEVGTYIAYEGESYESKCMNVFGEVVEDPRHPYGPEATRADYEANIVEISVPVWDFRKGSQTEKVTKTYTLQVHKRLAATVKALFEELYACEERYPVNSLGGYRWSEKSEHTPGLAIDINPNQNPYIAPDGTVLVGVAFDPENDPYSFEVGGEVEQIFNKYGFTRGIYWPNGYLDYMHFSFFGK